ncbi:hypothetical protein SODALDRAFT_378727 [Sodiomyces alkalinus F11]|uniref:LysM domain-containing protein n=1 Tax=Sodiomyces alkalinus (strain CBS 110278 / VKM F-3762 / F11) TaxID=1314773 RepID=A0A3N2PVN3_SODAK|nr:hypothetical protein SODALDRAFT_378727 [Sodiomyces alkalinus F11]ROT38532.1 hypothetical protein SODALDRAFT_378727 [Sodiomyces alkalinus F11]
MVGKTLPTVLTFAVSVMGAALPGITPPAVLDRDLSRPAAPTEYSLSCAHAWCQDGTSMCGYWAGITSWDISHGPRPGMVHTAVGPCAPGVADAEADAAAESIYGSQTDAENEEDASATSFITSPTVVSDVYAGTTTEQAAETATETVECAKRYCNEYGSLICHYWADVTAWDVNVGIIPGMTVTNLGPCPT